jgi:hypothetical protein
MALADWTPERMARFETDLAALAKVNTVAEKYSQEVPENAGVRQFMQEWYENEGMAW